MIQIKIYTMKKLFKTSGLVVIVILALACNKSHVEGDKFETGSSAGDSSKPDLGIFFKAGSKPGFYDVAKAEEKYNDMPVYFLQSKENVTEGFGTIMTSVQPGEFAGKRVRLSGNIKCEKVDRQAGMWMRIDGYTPGSMLGFDNMGTRPIEGTKDWQKYEVVLDVPDTSAAIAYGVLLNGNGTVWLSDLKMEAVGMDVPPTNMLTVPVQTSMPENKMSELPAVLMNIPEGIGVTHTPVNVGAVKTKEDTTMLYWFHTTSVKPLKEDIEITEFGSYYWMQDHWEFGNVGGVPFSPKDFADWYECKSGKMKKGKVYSDKNNWYRWPSLQRSTTLWYYIGKNKKGELFKGTAMVNYLPQMRESK